MRRIVAVVVVAGVVLAAAAMPGDDPPEPEFDGPTGVEIEASPRASVWYCPWINSGAEEESRFLLSSVTEVDASITLPSPTLNEDPDVAMVELLGPGSANVDVASIVRRGDAPGFVEFDDGPAAASSLVHSESSLAGDRCTISVPKVWHLPGGTTRDGRSLTLRLFNPFPEAAKVNVSGSSELGAEPLPELDSIDVPGRNWTNIDLNPLVPFLDELALVVTTDEGLVIPAMVLRGESDEATWPGTGLATTWSFPVTRSLGMKPSLVVMNPGSEEITVEVDAFGTSPNPSIVSTTVPAGAPLRIPLTELFTGQAGLQVRSTGPISAVVVVEDVVPTSDTAEEEVAESPEHDRIAVTVGAESPAQRWLLSGAGGVAGATPLIFVMNPGTDPATVTLQPLGSRSLPADKVIVAPGTTRRVRAPENVAVGAFLVDATSPVVAGWTLQAEGSLAYFAGVALDD